jgi:hypothetical protein
MCRTGSHTFVSVKELLVSLSIIICDGAKHNVIIAASVDGQPLASSATTNAWARLEWHRTICMTVVHSRSARHIICVNNLCWTDKL